MFLITSILCGLVGCASLSVQQKAMAGAPAPYTRFTMLDGSTILLEELRGKWVFLLFWASWCSHSRPAIEDFNEVAGPYRQRSDLYFLTASVDRYEEFKDVESRIRGKNLANLHHAFSGNDLQDEAFLNFQGDQVPYFVVISPEGIVEQLGTSVSVVESALAKYSK